MNEKNDNGELDNLSQPQKGLFEKKFEEIGIKILKIKRRNWFVRNIINFPDLYPKDYSVTLELPECNRFHKKTIKLNVYAPKTPSVDDICYSALKEITNILEEEDRKKKEAEEKRLSERTLKRYA